MSRAVPIEKRDQSIEQIASQIHLSDQGLNAEREPPSVQARSPVLSSELISEGSASNSEPVQKKLDMQRAGGNETMLPHDILKHQQQNDPKLKR